MEKIDNIKTENGTASKTVVRKPPVDSTEESIEAVARGESSDVYEALNAKEQIQVQNSIERLEKGSKPEVPECDCFPSDKNPPEPGSYYTHLGIFK